MNERLGCYSREDILNDHFFDDIQRAMCHFLGHSLVPLVDEPWPKNLALKKTHEVNGNRYLSGCEENFVYTRVSVEGYKQDQEEIIERGLRQAVERLIEKYGNHIRKKSGFMPYFIVNPTESLLRPIEGEEIIITICMAAYIQ